MQARSREDMELCCVINFFKFIGDLLVLPFGVLGLALPWRTITALGVRTTFLISCDMIPQSIQPLWRL
jgi:hypothetical protein